MLPPAAVQLLSPHRHLLPLATSAERYGAYASSPESAADIPKFLSAFRGQVDMQVGGGRSVRGEGDQGVSQLAGPWAAGRTMAALCRLNIP